MVIRSAQARRGSTGFTLIELMVAISISALLLLVALPLTSGWINGIRQVQVRGSMIDAVGRAKSYALRNSGAAAPGAAVALIQVSGGSLTVVERSGAVLWQADVPGSVDLTAPDGNPLDCVAFDSRGLQVSDAAAGCTTIAPTAAIAAASREDLHVDLL